MTTIIARRACIPVVSLILALSIPSDDAGAQVLDELLWKGVSPERGGVVVSAVRDYLEGHAMGGDASDAIAAARRAYWDAYVSGSGQPDAARAFQSGLRDKDLWLMLRTLVVEIYAGDVTLDERSLQRYRAVRQMFDLATGGPVDGGIPRTAQDEFSELMDAVMRRWVDATGGDAVNAMFRPDMIVQAINGSSEEYEVYREARDLVEIWRAHMQLGVELPDRTERELLQLHVRALDFIDSWDEAGRVYDQLAQFLGQPDLDRGLRAVRASGATREGVAGGLDGLDAVVEPDAAEQYVPWVLLRIPGSRGEMSRRGWVYPDRLDEILDRWTEIRRAVPATRIEEVATMVRNAPRTAEGFVADPEALGLFVSDGSSDPIPERRIWVQDATPRRILAALLTPRDPEGYARMLMFDAGWAGMRTPSTTFDQVVSWYGPEPVRQVAGEIAAMRRNGFGAVIDPDSPNRAEFPAAVFRKRLAVQHPAGYVREALALQHRKEHDEVLQGAALDAAYREVVRDAGSEEQVLQRVRTVAGGVEASGMAELDGYDMIVLRFRSEVNNPDYIAWEDFPEGTSSVYSLVDTRTLGARRGVSLDSIRGTVTLRVQRTGIVPNIIGARKTTRTELSQRFQVSIPSGQEDVYAAFELRIDSRYEPEALLRISSWDERAVTEPWLPDSHLYGLGLITTFWDEDGTERMETSAGFLECRRYVMAGREICLSEEVPGQVVYRRRVSDVGSVFIQLRSFEVPGEGRVEVRSAPRG